MEAIDKTGSTMGEFHFSIQQVTGICENFDAIQNKKAKQHVGNINYLSTLENLL